MSGSGDLGAFYAAMTPDPADGTRAFWAQRRAALRGNRACSPLWQFVKLQNYVYDRLGMPTGPTDPAWCRGNFWFDVSHGAWWPPGELPGSGSGLPVPYRILRDYPLRVLNLIGDVERVRVTPDDVYTVMTTVGVLKHVKHRIEARLKRDSHYEHHGSDYGTHAPD